MASAVTPNFLKGARKIEAETAETPSFLKGAKKIPQETQASFSTPEDDEREIERAQAQLTSRGLETVLGAPGDIASFISSLFGGEQNILPTSQGLREFSENASQGYTKPQTEFEESTGQLASDIASMALPGSGSYGLARTIGIPIVGALAKEGLKYANADERSQAYGKVGTMVALDLISNRTGGAKKFAGGLFRKAEESLPKGVSVDASNLERSLTALEKELTAGGSRPTTKKAIEKALEIKGEIKDGKIDIKRLAAYRPSINEAIEEMGGFNLELPKKLKPAAIRNLNQVKSEVIKNLNDYGKKFNPEFLKYNSSANEAWAAYENSNKIANYLRDKIPYSPKSKAAISLFSLAPHAAVGTLTAFSPVAGAGVLAGASLYQGYKVLDRVVKSPVLRKYYQGVLKGATARNAPAAARNLKALDMALSKETDQENQLSDMKD